MPKVNFKQKKVDIIASGLIAISPQVQSKVQDIIEGSVVIPCNESCIGTMHNLKQIHVVPFNDLGEDPDILNCQIRSQTNIYNLLSKKGTLEKIKSGSGIVVNEGIPFSEGDNANVAEDLYKRSLAGNNTIDYIQAQLDSMQEIVNS